MNLLAEKRGGGMKLLFITQKQIHWVHGNAKELKMVKRKVANNYDI